MKKTLTYIGAAMAMMAGLAACENGEQIFPDSEGGVVVYFANQYPVRTLVLGNDECDNSLDRQHKCAIYATMGGAYKGRNIVLDVQVDNTLCDNLYFTDDNGAAAAPVLPMPTNYYKLADTKIDYRGDKWGSVEVQLTDDYFNDPKAIETSYVIPMVIKQQTGADTILSGRPAVAGTVPARQDADGWAVQPKDFVLYCVRYINPWDASYIRRGVDLLTYGGKNDTIVRRNDDFDGDINAGDEVCYIRTRSMTEAIFPISVKFGTAASKPCDLLLTFKDNECTVTSATTGVTATGTGKFVTKGTAQAWGGKDRDVLYLDYSVDYGSQQVETKDTLVVRSRETNKKVTFTPKYVTNP